MDACQHRAEQVAHGQPHVDGDVPRYPLRERALEPVIDREGERYRTEDGKGDQEERPYRVDHQRSRLEQQFEQFLEPQPDAPLHVVLRPVNVHHRHRLQVLGRPAQLVELLVEVLLARQIRLLRVTAERFPLQRLLLFPVSLPAYLLS